MPIAIYGAKSLALGMYRAIEKIYPEQVCIGFVVNSKVNNPSNLAGLPVIELDELKLKLGDKEKDELHILVCTPEDLHKEISEYLINNSFKNITCMDSRKEEKLMERYFKELCIFESFYGIKYCNNPGSDSYKKADDGEENSDSIKIKVTVYQAKFCKDRYLNNAYNSPDWLVPIQVGAALTDIRVADVLDNEGDNISEKNVNYCELTALYWMWKNKLAGLAPSEHYCGLFHYRRILDVTDEDIKYMMDNDIDAVVAFPTLHEPDIKEHHSRYIKEDDWQAMLEALKELQPDYYEAYEDIFSQEYMYNYNMIIAKRSVLRDYCEWLFPILERTEELSTPKGWERKDRYIGYLGENLMTLYFFYNKDKYNILHTGRLMLT